MSLSATAQVNSWLKPSSGNWEEMEWSLGTLPGAGQSIMITNAGWKAVAIGPGTENYPDSLSVYSITLASPADSYNVLLFNYPGQVTPLTTRFLTVNSNTAITMLNAALNLNGGGGEGMSVGGQFTQDSASSIIGSQMDIGYIGPGVYNLISGNVWLQHIWLGGAYAGKMVQTGGTNEAGIVHLQSGGEYDLVDGDFNANVYFETGGLLRQQGGRINTSLGVYGGTYRLEGGAVYGGILVPNWDGYSAAGGHGAMIQTGGTNAGGLQIGYIGGFGAYTLSNGVSLAPELVVGARGTAEQWGGSQIVGGKFRTVTDYVNRDFLLPGSYTLNAGTLSAASMDIGGHYIQNGGTNTVAGDVQVSGAYADLELTGGELRCANTAVLGSWGGGLTQTGGRHIIANQLTVGAEATYAYVGYVLAGGDLEVSNILLTAGAKFTKTGGTLTQSGLLTSTAANLYFGAGTHHLGRLSLQVGPSDLTNSIIYLPVSAACVVAFEASASVNWADTSGLIITNWSGSWTGGGNHQVFFGASGTALSATQLGRIWFDNPAGFAPARYTARLLDTGEVVPDALPPTGHIPPVISLLRQSDGTMQIMIRGEPMANYAIDISTNLVNWTAWTNVATPEGVGSVTDVDVTAHPQRFYRGALLP